MNLDETPDLHESPLRRAGDAEREMAAGEVLFFVTLAGNGCGDGDPGTDTDGTIRPVLACP